MMDDRTRRLGQHTARTAPPGPSALLGPVPADSSRPPDWEQQGRLASRRTARCTATTIPGDPIGPEPSHQAPDQRAAWHQAYRALGPAGQPDVRAMPDGRLWLLRDTYAAQTAWAPRHVGKELRLSRLGAFDAALAPSAPTPKPNAARKAGDHDRAARHETPGRQLPRPARPLPAARTGPRPGHGRPAGMGARDSPSPQPGHRRRRRTTPPPPTGKIEPLRSGEPAAVSDTGHEQLAPAPDEKRTETVSLDPRPGRAAPGIPRRDATSIQD